MRAWTTWIFGLFLSPVGVTVLAALDSTLFFSLPFGIDAAVIILAARHRDVAWTIPLLAVIGSVAGAALTFWMGVIIGEKGLDRYVAPKFLDAEALKLDRRKAAPWPAVPNRGDTIWMGAADADSLRYGQRLLLDGVSQVPTNASVAPRLQSSPGDCCSYRGSRASCTRTAIRAPRGPRPLVPRA